MSEQTKSTVKERLRMALVEANMKPIELSERTGIPKSMISYYLNGKTKPKADRIFVISQVLGVSEAWLLGYDVPKNRTAEQKKNDDLAKIVVKMRTDERFYNTVKALAELNERQYCTVEQLIAAFNE